MGKVANSQTLFSVDSNSSFSRKKLEYKISLD